MKQYITVLALSLYIFLFIFAVSTDLNAAGIVRYLGDPAQTQLGLTVTRSDDRNATCSLGDCSLREAVNAANASATDDTINFASGLTTVTLINNEIVINNAGALTINGPSANILTIDGGAGTNRIFYTNQATVTISGVTLTGGNGIGGGIDNGFGGAIYANSGLLTLDGVHVTGNSVNRYGGGVGFFSVSGPVPGTNRIINSTISGNAATQGCGGIAVYAQLTIVNSTISGNTTAQDSGGFCSGGTSLAVVNSTISGNTAGGYAGGFSAYANETTLRNVTITNNKAQRGGGIYQISAVDEDGQQQSRLDLGNTIVAGNTATTGIGPEIYNEHVITRITSVGGNLVGDSPGDSTNSGDVAIAYQPTDIRDTNPMLRALANGTTPTHAPLVGSPVIDRGLNALALDPSNGNVSLAFDQRGTGFPRVRDGNADGTATADIGAFEFSANNVANIEELYAAVNEAQNAGSLIVIAPGVYMLSANAPGGGARPNGGRLDLQENMSLQGVQGDREAVVIDAFNLPDISYAAPPITRTGAIRMGRGTNSVEWLTIRNAVNGQAGIETDMNTTATAYIRVAHIVSTGNPRGIDVRNFGPTAAGRIIQAEIVDNDLPINRVGQSEGFRFTNIQGAHGGRIFAAISDNRSSGNQQGLLLANNRSDNATITVFSSGDRFFENGFGTGIIAGLSSNSIPANGNTINFTAHGSSFENNNGSTIFDRGGLVILGGENISMPNGTSNNTVNVTLRNCRFGNNQLYDIGAFGARSAPVSLGSPGTNNRVKIRLYRTLVPNLVTADSIPETPGGMNSVTVIRPSVVPSFDYDGDGRADLSVFRPSDQTWYLDRSHGGFDAVQFGLATDKLAPADFDGDGKTDIAVYRVGTWYLRRSQSGFLGFAFGEANDVPQPADFDGDGQAEIAVWRPSNGTWYVFNLATNRFTSLQLGTAGDKPAVGDYDGDGRADYAMYRPSIGNWLIQQSTAGFTQIQFGNVTDKPVPADYDGDGKTDLALFRPSEANWYLRNSTSNTVQTVNWGLGSDALVPGDYDGDGKADVAVYRGGIWYIRQSTAGISNPIFGLVSDMPTSQVQ